MSEKNGEIAFEIGRKARQFNSFNDIEEGIKEALDTKDRDHEALIGVLVGACESVVKRCAKPGMEDPFGNGTWDWFYKCQEALSHPLVQEYLKKTSLAGQSKKEEV